MRSEICSGGFDMSLRAAREMPQFVTGPQKCEVLGPVGELMKRMRTPCVCVPAAADSLVAVVPAAFSESRRTPEVTPRAAIWGSAANTMARLGDAGYEASKVDVLWAAMSLFAGRVKRRSYMDRTLAKEAIKVAVDAISRREEVGRKGEY
jgi:hypothetical protein